MKTPVMCLSIRQPWAWLITHGHKDIENRTWGSLIKEKKHEHSEHDR